MRKRITSREITNGNEVPTNLQDIDELYFCTAYKGCMMSKHEKCKNHDPVAIDFVNENLSSESENLEVKFLRWSKSDGTAK